MAYVKVSTSSIAYCIGFVQPSGGKNSSYRNRTTYKESLGRQEFAAGGQRRCALIANWPLVDAEFRMVSSRDFTQNVNVITTQLSEGNGAACLAAMISTKFS